MSEPTIPRIDELDPVIALLAKEGPEYLARLDDRPVRAADVEERAAAFDGSLPERGDPRR
jgi:hypothetical protein